MQNIPVKYLFSEQQSEFRHIDTWNHLTSHTKCVTFGGFRPISPLMAKTGVNLLVPRNYRAALSLNVLQSTCSWNP